MHATASADAHRLSGRWGSLEVHPFGATVSSWAPGGVEQLYCGDDAPPTLGAMRHGGIPLCAPWFGQGMGFDWEVPFGHGLISRVAWELLACDAGDAGATLMLGTDASATAHLPGADRFPDDLAYALEISAGRHSLQLTLTVTSPTLPTRVETVFHPYLAVDAPSARLRGLGGIAYHDYSDGTDAVEAESVPVDGALDRVYPAARPLLLHDAAGELTLEPSEAKTTIVWNPGPPDARFPGGEWQRFLCVEFGNAADGAVDIPVGGSHSVGMRVTRSR